MRVLSLQSGSNGNCILVQAAGRMLLFDAGISGIQAQRRMAQFGLDIHDVDAVVISHDHQDHVRCAGVYARKFHLPVYATAATFAAASGRCNLGHLPEVRHFEAGESLAIGEVRIDTLPTPHDGVDGVAFVVEAQDRRVGILTDLGHAFAALGDVIATLDGVLIESNYDPDMLRDGPYPWALQQRIRGPRGHLSNAEAAALVAQAAGPRLKWAMLGHLSQENNHPELARRTARAIIGDALSLHVASRYEAAEPLDA